MCFFARSILSSSLTHHYFSSSLKLKKKIDDLKALVTGILDILIITKKQKITYKITLVDEDKAVISDDQLISEELNQFFNNASRSFNIREKSYLIDKSQLLDLANKVISKSRNYSRSLLIKEKIRNLASLSFREASLSDNGFCFSKQTHNIRLSKRI